MILVDTNILVYAVGREHAHRDRSARLVERIGAGKVEAAIDAEVLQEVLHRYQSLRRWQDGRFVYEQARLVFQSILDINVGVMDQAKNLMDQYPALMTRDAVHAAVVQVYGLDAICSFDQDFDRISGLKRIEP